MQLSKDDFYYHINQKEEEEEDYIIYVLIEHTIPNLKNMK